MMQSTKFLVMKPSPLPIFIPFGPVSANDKIIRFCSDIELFYAYNAHGGVINI